MPAARTDTCPSIRLAAAANVALGERDLAFHVMSHVPTTAPSLAVTNLLLCPGAQANTVKLPLHLNLAACDLQLGEWSSAIDNCGEVSCLLSSDCMHACLWQVADARLECLRACPGQSAVARQACRALVPSEHVQAWHLTFG